MALSLYYYNIHFLNKQQGRVYNTAVMQFKFHTDLWVTCKGGEYSSLFIRHFLCIYFSVIPP